MVGRMLLLLRFELGQHLLILVSRAGTMMPHLLWLGIYPAPGTKVQTTAVALATRFVTRFPLHILMLQRPASSSELSRVHCMPLFYLFSFDQSGEIASAIGAPTRQDQVLFLELG